MSPPVARKHIGRPKPKAGVPTRGLELVDDQTNRPDYDLSLATTVLKRNDKSTEPFFERIGFDRIAELTHRGPGSNPGVALEVQRTVDEAEKVLADLASVRDELRRLMIEFSRRT
jgi:hypothetical protein